MTRAASAIYFGTVAHRRLKPRRHRLSYRLFSILFDLDELAGLGRSLRLFSYNRPNLFSFYDRDHGPRGETVECGTPGLRPYVEATLAAAGIALDGGAIRLLCSPRVLGYVFNPLSVYFCHRRDGSLAALLYEVDNTFGQRHTYLIPVAAGAVFPIRQSCAKSFYVSPFIAMGMTYHFRVAPPEGRVAIAVTASDGEGALLHAAFTGERAPLSDAGLLRAFCLYPLLTVKITAAIHWEALRLWLKGVRLHARPPAPSRSVTVVPAAATAGDLSR